MCVCVVGILRSSYANAIEGRLLGRRTQMVVWLVIRTSTFKWETNGPNGWIIPEPALYHVANSTGRLCVCMHVQYVHAETSTRNSRRRWVGGRMENTCTHTHSECSKLTAALGCEHGAVCVLCGCCASSADEFDVREYVVGWGYEIQLNAFCKWPSFLWGCLRHTHIHSSIPSYTYLLKRFGNACAAKMRRKNIGLKRR